MQTCKHIRPMHTSQTLAFEWLDDFDEIRSAKDEEVGQHLSALLSSASFRDSITHLLGKTSVDSPSGHSSTKPFDAFATIKTVKDFQSWVHQNVVGKVSTTYEAIEVSGLDDLDLTGGAMFISNHHDILMDPLVINLALLERGQSIANSAIGDNLLQSTESRHLAALCSCFKVMRSLSSPKAMLKAMRVQSQYINYLRFQEQKLIWIAQKEGRSKDKIDKTNPALIKMLSLAKPKDIDLEQFITAQKIVPVAISYEWDPCDADKSTQLFESQQGGYQKQPGDDLSAMQKGLFGKKGTIRVRFGQPVRAAEGKALNRYEVANQIDTFIAQNTAVFASNCAAHAMMKGLNPQALQASNPYAEHCDTEALVAAYRTLETRFPNHHKQSEEITKLMISAYAQSLLSKGMTDNVGSLS